MCLRPLHLLAALALGWTAAGGANGQSTGAAAGGLAERAGRIVQEAAATAGFSGAVVLMRDGEILYEGAVGLAQRKPDRPFTPDTPSDGGSLAKTLTAAAVWELVAEGRFAFDDPVVRHLPEYPYAQHTVRDLVSHRSGLPDYDAFERDFAPGQVRDTVDLLRALARRQMAPAVAPGVQFEYANLGFDSAALVVERVTGRRIAEWWQERYFAPLGIQTMFARPARFADWPGARTVGYRQKVGDWVLNDAFDGEAFIGASNVHASARDWARWGDGFARERVMPKDRLEAGLREPMLDSGMDNRLNRLSWYCDDGQRRCHYTGAYNGYFAQVYWDRARREVVAYVSNGTLAPWRCARLTRELVDALAGRASKPESVTRPTRIDAKQLPRWAGSYLSPALGPISIDARDGRLFVRVGRGERVSVFPASAAVFYAPMLDLWLAFSGTPGNPTLHLRSVFQVADAKRATALAGKS